MTTYAFPSPSKSERTNADINCGQNHGMTLTDWFAGQIVAAMLGCDPANATQRDQNGRLCDFDKSRLANLAKNAYQAAEALMQYRATAVNTSG